MLKENFNMNVFDLYNSRIQLSSGDYRAAFILVI